MSTPKSLGTPAADIAERAFREMDSASVLFEQMGSLFTAISRLCEGSDVVGLAQIGEQFSSMAAERLCGEQEMLERMLRETGAT